MIAESLFDDIRPYNDGEINAAMHRIVSDPLFPNVAMYIYPDIPLSDIKEMFCSFNSVHDFQTHIMYDVVMKIIKSSVTGLSYSGIENLDCDKRYLFVSNHRDISLDATILQYILNKEGHETSEISFGSNLMQGNLVIELGRANKMFRLVRGGSPREILKNSKILSQYLRYSVVEKRQSSWIAQRNGRTKDGNDATEQGLIKMFNMSGKHDAITNLAELNIAPVTVSYQFEPCDIQKARELFISISQKYIKRNGEDLESILKGILEPKGGIHYSFAKPITMQDMLPFADLDKNALFASIATLLDSRIDAGYKLWNTNYIAYDLLHNGDRFSDHYSNQEKDYFIERMEQKLALCDCNDAKVKELFINIYAAPVEKAYGLI